MENKKFRIALFMLPLLTQGGGAEKYFIELARNLRERGIETDIVTTDEKFFRKFSRLLHIFVLGNFFGKIDTKGRESEKNILRQLGTARWIKASYKQLEIILRNYDLVYAKNEVADLVLLKAKGYKNLPPIIVGIHTPLVYPKTKSMIATFHNWLYAGFFYKWLLKKTKCIHVSNSSAKKIIDSKLKLKNNLIYYPFSVRDVHESAQKNKSGKIFDSGKMNIIFVGRLSEQKGLDTLLKIIEKIGSNASLSKKVCLNIFGSGDKKYEQKLKSTAAKYPFVRYFGHIENMFIPDILSQQDCMIAPSQWETLPYSILEAQAMGLPVIAFDIPGPSDIIEDKRTGFLVNNGKDFFERLVDVTEGIFSFRREEITKNIENKFESEKIYEKMINMFENTICEN